MTRFGWLVLVIVLLVIAGIIGGWYLLMKYHSPLKTEPQEATTTPAALSANTIASSSIYTNGTFGISFIYPGEDTFTTSFTPWREGVVATGTPVVALTDADGVMRIGASANAKEIKACTKAGPGESALPDAIMGTTTFKAFTHDDLGTDNEQRITSYRTLHNKACFAIETVQPLENGVAATSTRLAGIVQSFMFAR